MQASPEGDYLHFFVELHHVGIFGCVCIRVRWQVVNFILLGDMIDTLLMRWSLLTQHHLLGKGDDKLDGGRVDLAEGLGNWIVVLLRYCIIHEELEYESVLLFQHLDAHYKSTLVIRQLQQLHLTILRMLLSLGPDVTEFGWILTCIDTIGIDQFRVPVELVCWNTEGTITHHTVE